MPFGLGLGELVIVLVPLLVMGAAVGGVILVARRLLGGRTAESQLLEERNQRLTSELRDTRVRVESLEAQVAQLEEGLAFTQSLLENRTPPAQMPPPER